MSDRWYKEWEPGQRFEPPIRRTVTDIDNLVISTLTQNQQPLRREARGLP